jgi:CubicO group peptidase (beta-lactamase class C family)
MFARPAPPLGRRRLLLLLLPLSLAGLLLLPQRLASPSSTPDRWHRALSVLERAVSARVFPGAVALVADAERGVLLRAAVGNMTYDHDPTPLGQPGHAVGTDTIFDMASCSKVAATTTAVALLFGDNVTALDTPVAHFLPGYGAGGKAPITVRNCLLHDAGLPPDPTPFDYWDPKFGCAGAPLPDDMSFSCAARIYAAFLEQELAPGAVVGAAYVYSDLSFITLMYVVGTVALDRGLVTPEDFLPACGSSAVSADSPGDGAGLQKQCAFEAFVRLHVFQALGMDDTGYLPVPDKWPRCAPTWVPDGEPGLHGHALQGQVEDGNCYIMGGVAGHAGVFSTVDDLAKLMRAWMKFDGGAGDSFLSPAAVDLFVRQNNHSQSSRALGWNTNDESAQPDGGWGQSCGNLSARTFTHVGFTGTQLCGDPENSVFTILLTARVYGTPNTGNSTGIHAARKAFNSEVARALSLPAYPGR